MGNAKKKAKKYRKTLVRGLIQQFLTEYLQLLLSNHEKKRKFLKNKEWYVASDQIYITRESCQLINCRWFISVYNSHAVLF